MQIALLVTVAVIILVAIGVSISRLNAKAQADDARINAEYDAWRAAEGIAHDEPTTKARKTRIRIVKALKPRIVARKKSPAKKRRKAS